MVRYDGLYEGSQAVLEVKAPWRRRWVARHETVEPPRRFVDVQQDGPMASWRHEHRLEPAGAEACVLHDTVSYEMPMGPLGSLAHRWFARAQIEQMFTYRHRLLQQDLAEHQSVSQGKAWKIAVTGSGGGIGSALVAFLESGGHTVVRVKRGAGAKGPTAQRVGFEIEGAASLAQGLSGCDAVVHLAGEPILDGPGGRWDEAKRERILKSRTEGTQEIAHAIAQADAKPGVLVCASAMGYYGYDRHAEVLTESSQKGQGFLSDVTAQWEAAAGPARDAGVRTVHLRFGMVLDPRSGGLASMLPPFKLGLGGRLGTGTQWMSWISIEDAVSVVHHAIGDERYAGAINSVSPQPVTNQQFTQTLATVLKRPAVLPAPAFALKLVFGADLTQAMLLGSFRVIPERLSQLGYAFRHPDLETCLRTLLGRAKAKM